MQTLKNRLCNVGLLIGLLSATHLSLQAQESVELKLDTSEAEQALAILSKSQSGEVIGQADWAKLFATIPYQWLKERETAIGAPFTDEDFKTFLLSESTAAKRVEWERTLAAMKAADMRRLGTAVLDWLPQGAEIHARVFPEIKPRTNSFVWTKKGAGPAIFLYLENQTQAQFENTVSHECHHIGLESLEGRQDALQADLPPNVRQAMKWMSAFGEGEAMLAAAGTVEKHPHWEDDALIRARWDSDMMHFNADLVSVQALLLDILDGRLTTDAEIQKRASPFWGVQGAWYTVGYEMSVLVEMRFGRIAFDDCLIDPRKLLVLYNKVASEANAKGATLNVWSPDLLAKLGTAGGSAT